MKKRLRRCSCQCRRYEIRRRKLFADEEAIETPDYGNLEISNVLGRKLFADEEAIETHHISKHN